MFRNELFTPFAARGATPAMAAWREAAELVSTRWAVFLEADAEARPWAFASYVAALDAEEAAAAETARRMRAAA